MSSRRFFSCKYPEEIHELAVIHPYALIVFAHLVKFCFEKDMPAPILTSIARTHEENLADGAESDSHVTLRAFDISSRPYTSKQIGQIQTEFGTHFLNQFAAVNTKGESRLVVYHKVTNGAFHFHFQVHARYRLPPFKGL